MAGILFGGSLFVLVMYRILDRVTQKILESEQLEARLLAAEEANRVKTSFLANMSHEMRTPLNVILGLDGVALKNPELLPETRDQLEKIGQSSRYLLRLINNILEMNQACSGALAGGRCITSPNTTSSAIHPVCPARGLSRPAKKRDDPGRGRGWTAKSPGR